MDKKWTTQSLRSAVNYIETALTSIENSDKDAISDFYGNITSAYWELNQAWNALGIDDVSEYLQNQKQLDELRVFPASIDIETGTDPENR